MDAFFTSHTTRLIFEDAERILILMCTNSYTVFSKDKIYDIFHKEQHIVQRSMCEVVYPAKWYQDTRNNLTRKNSLISHKKQFCGALESSIIECICLHILHLRFNGRAKKCMQYQFLTCYRR